MPRSRSTPSCATACASSPKRISTPRPAQDFEKTAVALALYGHYPVDLVERALIDDGSDMVLILARAANLSRATVKALLMMHAGGRGLSEQDLEHALASFDRLKSKTAKRVLEFYEKAQGSRQGAKNHAGGG